MLSSAGWSGPQWRILTAEVRVVRATSRAAEDSLVRTTRSVIRGAIRRCGMAGASVCVLWLAGLLWFAIPPSADFREAPTDAIVVLTGGRLRLQTGIELLREGKGRALFVSGVNQQVDLDDLLRISGTAPDRVTCCVELGHEADNTFGNAQETARWIRARGFRSLRLVTAWYHMPRSLLEFDRAMPEIEIVAHPVFPDQVMRERWWASPGTTLLLMSEYSKFLGTLSRPLLEWLHPPARSVSEPDRAEIRR